MPGHRVSTEELEEHLKDQLEFLERSSEAFDRGYESEAKRIALAVRILLHDTRSSQSLLGQLGTKETLQFVDTAGEANPANKLSDWRIVQMTLGGGPSKFVAPLDDLPRAATRVPFGDWWERVIFKAQSGESLTRRTLILACANQDGGAHVDHELDEAYAALIKRNALAITVGDGKGPGGPIEPPHKAAIRQVAHELLKTLVPGYEKMPVEGNGLRIAASELVLEPAEPTTTGTRWPSKVGRNDPCPCGSGKKFKKCHGRHPSLRGVR